MNVAEESALNDILLEATAGNDQAIEVVIEAIGNDDHATKALVEFMDGFSETSNPTLLQIKFNHQLAAALFKHIAEYVVSANE